MTVSVVKTVDGGENNGVRLGLRVKGTAFIALGAVLIGLLIFWLIMGYIVRDTSDPNAWVDGIGRLIDQSPAIIRPIIPYWPGIVWFIVDIIFALIAIVGSNMAIIKGKELLRGVERKRED